jgi:hypothetical protein
VFQIFIVSRVNGRLFFYSCLAACRRVRAQEWSSVVTQADGVRCGNLCVKQEQDWVRRGMCVRNYADAKFEEVLLRRSPSSSRVL